MNSGCQYSIDVGAKKILRFGIAIGNELVGTYYYIAAKRLSARILVSRSALMCSFNKIEWQNLH